MIAAAMGGIYGGVAAFNPASLYTSGQLGAWYDPSDLTTLYQDSAGTTAVTAVTQPVGKALDKSGRSNHASQATASARPLLSARVNLLTKTEDFANAVWGKANCTQSFVTAPDGSTTAQRLTATAAGTTTFAYQASVLPLSAGGGCVTFAVKAGSKTLAGFGIFDGSSFGALTSAVIIQGPGAISASGSTLTSVTGLSSTVWTYIKLVGSGFSASAGLIIYPAGTSGVAVSAGESTDYWHPQLEAGSTATTYQRVNTATDYDTVGFPQYLTFDGIDDGLSTSAITLGADMDCFIAVRRNSATGILAYTTAGSGVYLGAIDATAGAASAGAGTPTYVSNGVAVAGGTATTRAQLAAAVPISSWVVLEIQDANLSAWAALATGAYTGFILGADIGGVILSPAGNAASRQKIRTYLGAKVGLSL